MRKIGVFVDLSNLYFCIGKRYKGRKINYQAYMDFVKELGDVEVAYAYGAQYENEADRFFSKLRDMGYYVRVKEIKEFLEADQGRYRLKADWDVGVTLDIVSMCDRLNTVVLGSADGDFEPVVEWCVAKGIRVIVLACEISKNLRDKANECIEIPPSLLEQRNEATKAKRTNVSDRLSSHGAGNDSGGSDTGVGARRPDSNVADAIGASVLPGDTHPGDSEPLPAQGISVSDDRADAAPGSQGPS